MQPSSFPASVGDAAIVSAGSARADHMHTFGDLAGLAPSDIMGVLDDDTAVVTRTWRIDVDVESSFKEIQGLGVQFSGKTAPVLSGVEIECPGGWLSPAGKGAAFSADGVYRQTAVVGIRFIGDVVVKQYNSASGPTMPRAAAECGTVTADRGLSGSSYDIGAAHGRSGAWYGHNMSEGSTEAPGSNSLAIVPAGDAAAIGDWSGSPSLRFVRISDNYVHSSDCSFCSNSSGAVEIVETLTIKRVH